MNIAHEALAAASDDFEIPPFAIRLVCRCRST
jgi:hypothetical protein